MKQQLANRDLYASCCLSSDCRISPLLDTVDVLTVSVRALLVRIFPEA